MWTICNSYMGLSNQYQFSNICLCFSCRYQEGCWWSYVVIWCVLSIAIAFSTFVTLSVGEGKSLNCTNTRRLHCIPGRTIPGTPYLCVWRMNQIVWIVNFDFDWFFIWSWCACNKIYIQYIHIIASICCIVENQKKMFEWNKKTHGPCYQDHMKTKTPDKERIFLCDTKSHTCTI